MTAMAQNSELTLFVTHVEAEGPLLKIWGQVDRNAATCVERMILPLSEKFAQGLGVPNPNYILPPNLICCARFQNDGYYRAKIINIQPSGNVLVHFIDYGNYEVLPPSTIRLLENIPSVVSLHALPPLAFDFILANVVAANGSWEMETVESIKQTLRYADIKGMFHSTVGNHRLLKLCYNNEDFGTLLVTKNLAIHVSIQEMFASRRQPLNRPVQFSREPQPPSQANNYTPRGQSAYVEPARQNTPQENWRSRASAHAPEALVFKSRVLDVGSVHDVYVSYVEDGPMKFSVQVQSTEQILKQLMNDINSYPTAPLQEPPLPGSVCLGRYSLDKVLCRAVVMSVMEQKCKLYYVDFGHTEVLSYSDIFQLPPQYINPRVLSIRFTLSGLKDMVITQATKDYFKELVSGKPLVLQVRPPEGPPLIQYGDLYDNGTNVRDIIKERCDVAPPAFYQEPPRLARGFKDLAHVSFVESCSKFFLQLDSGIKSLSSIMACLDEYAKDAPQLDENYLKVGWPCCACYGEDKQWYRAQILDVKGDQVVVLYVDYGNEETVAAQTLRKIHNNLVINLRAQAIRCVLNGFQNSPFNQELANQFEALVLEKKLAMEVVDVQPNNSLVELLDCDVVPMVSISSKLQFPTQNNRPVNNAAINTHREPEQGLNSSRSPDLKYQSDKWARNGKPNTWGQEPARSNEWSARNRKSHSDQNNHDDGKDQFQDRGRAKIVKDVENEQRQRESNRHEGEDRLHQKETHSNNYFNRNNSSRNRFERNDDTASKRGRGSRFGSSGTSRDDSKALDKSFNKDDSWSDRDSDTSSRSSGKRGSKGPRGIKGRGDRAGRRGGDRKPTSGKWSDGDSDRSSQQSGQGSGLRSKDRNSPNPSSKNAKPNKSGSWNSMSPTSPVKEPPRVQKLRIPPPNITVGAVKNAEVIYTDSPTDFYVQLCPDNLELDKLMEKIGRIYNSGGTILRRSDVQQGNCCIAQYSCDSKWYRAVVKSNNADSANVHFIDYGNSETVGHDKIKAIEAELAKLSAQAVHCRLFAATKSTWSDEEIDRFAQSVEGISLEAEFLAQQNGIYDVLMKPATAGDSDYVNKIFCGDVDLAQAKRDLKNKSSKGSPKKKREVVPQYIPAGQKWGDETFATGYQVDVVVTWFVNPNNFYCQILSKQSEFRTMMNNIQESYVEQQAIRNKLQVGDPVIAFFSDDGALYRAEIKELNKLRGHIVQYVDFGNCAMVDPCKIYPVEQRFALLSKQAMHCSLRNVSPAQGVDWSKANKHEIDKYFDADKYKCTFHGTKDGKYSISLSNNGRDIGETMIAAGLAVDSETQEKTVVNAVSTSADANAATKDAEKRDLTLWSGQTIRTRVHNAQGAAKFYIQLPESGEIVNKLKSSTTANGAGAQNPLVECYLLNVNPTPQVDEVLKTSVEGKDVIVSVKSVNNNRFGVQLYNNSGKRLRIVEPDTEDNVSPICPLPVSKSTEKVWVTHIENAERMWLQRSSDSDNIADLLSSLYEFYSVSGSPLVPEVGKLCVAESSDKNWYRGAIEKVEENGEVEVRFVDYGNTEKVSSDAVKTLEQQFYSWHKMAIEVSMTVTLKGSEEEQKSILHENLDDRELTATFYNVGKAWLVDLAEDGKKISEKLSELGAVAEFKEIKSQQQEIPEMIVGNRYEVFLSHSDSPAQFWLQRNEEIDAIEAMQASLQVAAPNFSPTTGIPEEGTLCAALYSADSLWYRAEVLDADEDITTVRFIDYGNTDVIDSNSSSIKELPQSWKSVKKYGLKSRLDLIPTGSEDWSTASCEMFETMATATESPITALIIADSVPRRVELFVNGEDSVGDALVREGHAIMVHNAEDLIDEIIDLELDPRSAFVSHVNSPDEFWVQEEKSVSDLEIMTDRFIVAEMFPKLDEITEGSLCVAKFPDDDQWYRACVNSHGTEGTQVLYIDYGNSAVSTEVRTIPEDLAAVPPLSRKCRLQLPAGVKEWSEKACEKFVDLAADGATIFLLDVEEEGETSVVSLTLEGVNVAEELAKLCEILPVIDERLPPLGEENSPNIVVSHVYSPSEFWTQTESNMGELEIMAGRLIDAQSLLPLNTFEEGTICAAKFPEDGGWYRAKILSHGESGTNVLYFDYGNSAVTNELRILPEDVANIPSLATRCTLAMPKDVEAWSEEANNKFNKLVADGVTMFQFEILDDNDPALITLHLDGMDVVDILKPLCLSDQKALTAVEIKEEIVEPETMATEEEGVRIKTEIMEEHQETEIQDKTTEDIIVSEESAPKVQINGEKNLCEDEIETQIDNTEPSEEKAQNNGVSEDCEIKETKTDKSEAPVAEEVQINGSDTVCETELAPIDIVNDIPEDEIVQKINGVDLTIEKVLDTKNEELVSEKELTTEIKLEPSEIVEKTESPLPQVQISNVDPVDDSPEVITLDDSVPKNLIEVEAQPTDKEDAKSVPVKAGREPETLKELTVDDIVGNMVKVALVDGSDLKEEIPELKTSDEVVSKDAGKPEQTSDEVSKDSVPSTPQKTPKMDKIVPGSISRGSMEEDIPPSVLGRRRSSCTDDKIVPGSINKGTDLSEADCEIVAILPQENRERQVERKEISVPVTPGKTQKEEKIVPGSISRGESPTVEISRPTTPKTPHSEKLLAGVVNLQENLSDFEEQDEILIVEVENNIPDEKA